MITTAIALLITIQAPQQDSTNPTKLSASQIMSKVFSRYASAQTISGTVKMSQTARDVTVHINTELQYERPGKIYIHQARDGSHPQQWLLTSDGREFSYDRPEGAFGRDRFVEWVSQNGVDQKIQDLYMAAEKSLGEQNAVLDIAVSQPNRLKLLLKQWATLSYDGRVTVNGDQVHKITGQYRENVDLPPAGTYEIDVSENYDLVRYITDERRVFSVPKQGAVELNLHTEWDSNLQVGAKVQPNLFRVVK